MKSGNLSFAANKADSTRAVDTDYFDKRIRKLIMEKVRYLMKTGLFPENIKEDIYQRLSIMLWNAQKNFDFMQSNKYTFARCVLANRAKNMIDAAVRRQDNEPVEMLSIDLVVNADGDEYGDMIDSDDAEMSLGNRVCPRIESLDLRDSEEYAITQLPPESQRICRAILAGETISSLAHMYGISRTAFRKKYLLPTRKVFVEAGLADFCKGGF
jgi:hypothetical protein